MERKENGCFVWKWQPVAQATGCKVRKKGDYNRDLSIFGFWKRAESDCLHTKITRSIVLWFIHRISTIHSPFNLVCRQSLSALFQKLYNNRPSLKIMILMIKVLFIYMVNFFAVAKNAKKRKISQFFCYIAKFVSSLIKNISLISEIFRYIAKYFAMNRTKVAKNIFWTGAGGPHLIGNFGEVPLTATSPKFRMRRGPPAPIQKIFFATLSLWKRRQ